ncbi:dienelactone hydrolase family protein [Streptomyces griseoluteus]|uniref:dienelactone hydrolase family protein n=1 Tax=Streptomyces griseoluteus TaxID=29306 RepID=UPI0036FB45EE
MTVHSDGPDKTTRRQGGEEAEGQERALVVRYAPRSPKAAVLTLHGGRAEDVSASRPWHLAALRMRPVLRAVATGLPSDGIVLGEVRYRHRGWNGGAAAHDVLRALGELREKFGPLPVVLVGHSMGGRAALHVAAHPAVRGVLALAPWLPAAEPAAHLRGRRLVVMHGDADRITGADDSVNFVLRARTAGAHAGMIMITGAEHAMLRRLPTWHRLATEIVADLLRDHPAKDGTVAEALAPGAPAFLRV